MSVKDATSLHAALTDNYTTDGQGNFGFNCSLDANLSVIFGSVAFSISPLDYVGAVVESYGLHNFWCQSNIQGIPSFAPTSSWTFGTMFLRNVSILAELRSKMRLIF
jgi:hypothetical protein